MHQIINKYFDEKDNPMDVENVYYEAEAMEAARKESLGQVKTEEEKRKETLQREEEEKERAELTKREIEEQKAREDAAKAAQPANLDGAIANIVTNMTTIYTNYINTGKAFYETHEDKQLQRLFEKDEGVIRNDMIEEGPDSSKIRYIALSNILDKIIAQEYKELEPTLQENQYKLKILKKLLVKIHPDKLNVVGEEKKGRAKKVAVSLTAAKDVLSTGRTNGGSKRTYKKHRIRKRRTRKHKKPKSHKKRKSRMGLSPHKTRR